MPRPNFLDRFRPVGSPGAAARTGIPTEDARGPEAELAPVFAALEADLEECSRRVEDARRTAGHDVAEARSRADAVVARARLDADSARRRAYDAVLASAALGDAGLDREAEGRADAIAARGHDRMAQTVHAVVERLLAAAAEG